MLRLQKLLRAFGAVVGLLVLVVVIGVLIHDPPPLRLRLDDEAVIAVPIEATPRTLGGSIESGLSCKRKLEAYMSDAFWRPKTTIFDWLKEQNGELPEQDMHLVASKPNETWAIRVDRKTNTFCSYTARDVELGMTDPYCGPKITHETADRIVAVEDELNINVINFFKKKYTAIISNIDAAGATIS